MSAKNSINFLSFNLKHVNSIPTNIPISESNINSINPFRSQDSTGIPNHYQNPIGKKVDVTYV